MRTSRQRRIPLGVVSGSRRPLRSAAAAALLSTAAAALLPAAVAPAGEQDRVRWLGETRHIAVLVPPTAKLGAPLLLALGNPGRSARYALESWREVATQEGFVVAAVSSQGASVWREPQDGSGFLRAVVQRVNGRHRIDPRRVYLFGAGVGGGFALSLAAQQPLYFAAAVSFGGGMQQGALLGVDRLERALPVRIFYSKRTLQFDVDDLTETAATLRRVGAEVAVERLDVGSDFERRGRKVAGRIWAALEPLRLAEAPRYRRTPRDR